MMSSTSENTDTKQPEKLKIHENLSENMTFNINQTQSFPIQTNVHPVTIRHLNMIVQGLDLIVTHHNELAVTMEELSEVVELSKYLSSIATSYMRETTVPLSFFKSDSSNTVRGFGSKV
jgi:hypothetical protein